MTPSKPAFSRAYLAWALVLLLLVYTCNFVDRTILAIVQQPIKEELKLTDLQMGLLGGLAFAALYGVFGVLVARMAERRERRTIITVSVTVWSVMTALCGGAGNFAQLALLRAGVGIGEAGCVPASQSLVADYFPPHRRATALSILSLGVPLGTLFGALMGGWIAQTWGWRLAFVIVGAPGLLLAILTQFTLREPVRGGTDAPAVDISPPTPDVGLPPGLGPAPSMGEVARRLISQPAVMHMAAGATLVSFAAYAIGGFTPPFLMRNFHVDVKTAGLLFALAGGGSAGIGTFLGGWLTDRLGRRDQRAYAFVPAISLLIAAPLYALGFSAPTLAGATILLIPPVLHYTYLGPTYAVLHNSMAPRMRATATALLLLGLTLIGLGLGPVALGLLSDVMASRVFHGLSPDAAAFAHACPGGRAPTGAPAALSAACAHASASGVRQAIVAFCAIFAWGGVHYLLAARRLREAPAP